MGFGGFEPPFSKAAFLLNLVFNISIFLPIYFHNIIMICIIFESIWTVPINFKEIEAPTWWMRVLYDITTPSVNMNIKIKIYFPTSLQMSPNSRIIGLLSLTKIQANKKVPNALFPEPGKIDLTVLSGGQNGFQEIKVVLMDDLR